MSGNKSPLAPRKTPVLPPLDGVRLATVAAGIKYSDRDDLMVMVFDQPASVAGVFTRSMCPSAPVEFCRQNLPYGKAQILVVNSGNANAFTGVKGRQAVEIEAHAAAEAMGCSTNQVYLSSTGVIGEPLAAEQFSGQIAHLVTRAVPDNWFAAASAIMTTDTFSKLATAEVKLGNQTVRINAIAKGAGMIAPDMATMLCYVVTDAPIAPDVLQTLLSKSVKASFNAITVDSDTSTSDTVLAFATGTAGGEPISDVKDPRVGPFRRAFNRVLKQLAQQIVMDGEGASKFIEVNVTGAKSSRSAHRIALSIANSPLVKTAVAGEDANWGRVVMAVGKAGEPADRDLLSIWFGSHRVAFHGERDPDYVETDVAGYMKGDRIQIRADIGIGKGKATVWTCDLTKDYIAINADYRS